MEAKRDPRPSSLRVAVAEPVVAESLQAPDWVLSNELRDLADRQKVVLPSLLAQIPNPQNTRSLMNWYESSPMFARTIEIARTNTRNKKFREAEGAAFEELAYLCFASDSRWKEKLEIEGILLSGKQTDEFFNLINPVDPVQSQHPHGNSIRDVNVPDGILVGEDGLISGFVEYTMAKLGKLLPKNKKYRSFLELKEKRPKLFKPDAKLIFVVPEKTEDQKVLDRDLKKEYEDVEIAYVPFMRFEIEKLLERHGIVSDKRRHSSTSGGKEHRDRQVR